MKSKIESLTININCVKLNFYQAWQIWNEGKGLQITDTTLNETYMPSK